ncbi:MAG TPA: pilus assembly protein TadG-related protein [Candidatus Limnocylindria bacterium]|nr:pilus assembly protein TadG-related protein [Candidatus Limnocylindria bacterium]
MLRRHDEHGQILVMVAAGMVLLVAIAAIVVDLGMSWMLRRQEQNAADPAAIAAARFIKPYEEALDQVGRDAALLGMDQEACFYAQENYFFLGDANCAAALASGDLEVNYPPSGPMSAPYSGRPGFVQVVIHATHPSFFGQFLGQPFAQVDTTAIAAHTTGNSNSSSLVALQAECQGGSAGNIVGGGHVRIFPAAGVTQPGGYIHVNSPCGSSTDDICDNGVGQAALSISGTLEAPYAYMDGSCTINGASGPGLVCPGGGAGCLDEDHPPLFDPLANMPEPDMDDFPAGVCPDGTVSTPSATSGCDLRRGPDCPPDPLDAAIDICTLDPGVYYGGFSVGSRVRLQLNPGMYILAGGGISLSGSSSIESVAGAIGVARITIFSTDGPGCPAIAKQCQGAITITAQQSFLAKATNTASCQALAAIMWTCPWRGILLWQDGTEVYDPGGSPITLGGGSNVIISGTIYAPLDDVSINGGQDTTGCDGSATASCLAVQIISYTWKIDGNALVEMPYDPAELYQLEQRGLVH